MTAVVPYLEGPVRARFDAWLVGTVERHSPPLTFAEVRKGVRAISALYVERRDEGPIGPRALDGAGKRAALATYYAPLHFLAASHVLATPELGWLGASRRCFDLGCGTGAVGAALAMRSEKPPELEASDRSGWAVSEARRTHRAFGLAARARRAALPSTIPRGGAGKTVVLGWVMNELDPATRDRTLLQLVDFTARGGALLILEPLATRVTPWWKEWTGTLARAGATDGELRFRLELPTWIGQLDRAAGLDHGELGVRFLAVAGRSP